MKPDFETASAFLNALDPTAATWTFQTFDDKGRRDRRMSKVLHGSLSDHFGQLARLNEAGAGIFVVPNETDGQGRTKANITRIRALFVDLDGAPLEPLMAAEVPPHLVVETSPNRFHAYWRVEDCALDECEPALKELIQQFGADPLCSDRSRVLRLPGFDHRKGEPYRCRIHTSTPGVVRLNQLLPMPHKRQKEQKLLTEPTKPTAPTFLKAQTHQMANKSQKPWEDAALRDEIERAITACLPTGEGHRHSLLFKLARWLKSLIPDATKPQLRAIVKEWHERALPYISTKEFNLTWGEFHHAWENVRVGYLDTLHGILDGIDFNAPPPPSLVELDFNPNDIKLTLICKALAAHWHPDPFILDCRTAARLLQEDHKTSNNRLHGLAAEGVIERVEIGTRGKASSFLYRWHE